MTAPRAVEEVGATAEEDVPAPRAVEEVGATAEEDVTAPRAVEEAGVTPERWLTWSITSLCNMLVHILTITRKESHHLRSRPILAVA